MYTAGARTARSRVRLCPHALYTIVKVQTHSFGSSIQTLVGACFKIFDRTIFAVYDTKGPK